MHGCKTANLGLLIGGLMIGLSACSTTDALTPQADIPNAGGTASRSSSPVTQSDAERLAYDNSDGRAGREAASRKPASTRAFGAQNTLQAQAEAMQQGESEAAARTPPAQSAPQPAQTQTAKAEAASRGSIRFLPIIGAPVQAVTPLSRQLGAEARANGLTIKSSADASSEHILKGYFSAVSEGSKTTITYVWDVLDGGGTRLHRIQGQETAPGGGAEPWAGVPAAAMQSIATKTLRDYMSWRQNQSG